MSDEPARGIKRVRAKEADDGASNVRPLEEITDLFTKVGLVLGTLLQHTGAIHAPERRLFRLEVEFA